MVTFVQDAMTGTNWSDLHLHTGATGATWARHTATPSSRWYIFDNKVHCGVPGIIYASGTPASANYSVECDYTRFTNVAAIGIAGRISTSAATFYYTYELNGEVVLAKQINGVITSLEANVSGLMVNGSTYRLKLEMIGTAIKVFVGGVQRISVVDADITAAGKAGVRSPSSNDAGTGKHIDNFLAFDTSIAVLPANGGTQVVWIG